MISMKDSGWLNLGVKLNTVTPLRKRDHFRMVPKHQTNQKVTKYKVETDMKDIELPFTSFVGKQRFKFTAPNIPTILSCEVVDDDARQSLRRKIHRDVLLGKFLFWDGFIVNTMRQLGCVC